MGPNIAIEMLRAIISGMILAILFGAIATWVWTIRRLLTGQPLLPETWIIERRKPPWGVGTILLVLATYVLASREAFETYARMTRAQRPGARAEAPVRVDKVIQDPGLVKPVPKSEGGPPRELAKDAPREPGAAPQGRPAENEADGLIHGLTPLEVMSIQGLINGVFIFLVPGIARLTSKARLRDLGLSLHEWRRQAAVGVVAVLFLMPIVYSVQAACIYLLDLSAPEMEKNKHPLEKMLRENFSPGIASLAFLTAVVLAPAFEELLFRGFIQPWLVKNFDRFSGWLRPAPSKPAPAPLSLDEAPQPDHPLADPEFDRLPADPDAGIEYWEAEDQPQDPAPEDEPLPDADHDPDVPYRPRSTVATGVAIVLTSLIFAGLHAPQWPAPIPLFLLALGLGLVAERTGSLLAPICMHAIFNGFSTLMLFYVALEKPDPAKPPARPVLERVVPGEKAGVVDPDVGPGRQPGKA